MQLYTGCVENRMDPLKLGRCQVRVVGVHTHLKADLPTEDLPWAHPMQPLNSAAISGIGFSPTGPVEGTWVVIYFRDYPDNQQPVILGTVGGIPQEFGSIDEDDLSLLLKDDYGVAKNGTQVTTDASGTILSSGDVGEPQEQSTTPDYSGLRPVRDFSEVSSKGIALIKQFEGLELEAYQDSVGVWTVGYGTTRINGVAVQANRRITKEEAEKYLLEDLKKQFLPGVKRDVKALVSQSMVDALCCFAYNLGNGNLKNSTLLSELNAGNYENAAARFNDWVKAGGKVLKGLVTRRNAERALFLSDGIPNIAGGLTPVAQEQVPVGQSYTDSKGNTIERSTGLSNQGSSSQYGFRDPTGKYPLYTNEPDTHKLARNEDITNTIVFKKDASRDKSVEIANSTETWDQSPNPYNAQYPFNHVYCSESGHIFEFDDTPNSERINLHHKSGTFSEIDANGTRVNRIVGDGYEILERNGYVHIIGSQYVTIEGSQKVKVKNALDLEVDGATTINIYNNATVNVSGNAKMSVGGEYALRAASIKMETTGNIDIKAGGNFAVDYVRGDFGTGAASSGLSAPQAVKEITEKTFSKLTTVNRSLSTSQTYETPEEGDPSSFIARQLERGNIASDELNSGEIVSSTGPIENNLVPEETDCDFIRNMDTSKFSSSLVLSKYFNLGQVTSNWTRKPCNQFGLTPQDIVCNLRNLCVNVLDPIKERWPNMIITNAFRKPGDVSASSKVSQHYKGQAADIVLGGFSRTEHYEAIQEIQQLVPYDQLLLEYSGPTTVWIHISFITKGIRKQHFTMRDHSRVSDFGTFTLIT